MRIVFQIAVVAVLMGMGISCSQVQPIQSVDRIVEEVAVAAPPKPELCPDPERPLPFPEDQTALYLIIFTEEYCDACARQLAALKAEKSRLDDAHVMVVQGVMGSEGACFQAAKMGRTAPFPYSAISDEQQREWAVRSTPTMWLVNPKTWETIRYVEGLMSVDEILDAIPKS